MVAAPPITIIPIAATQMVTTRQLAPFQSWLQLFVAIIRLIIATIRGTVTTTVMTVDLLTVPIDTTKMHHQSYIHIPIAVTIITMTLTV